MSSSAVLAPESSNGRPTVAPDWPGGWAVTAAVVCSVLGVGVLVTTSLLGVPGLAPAVAALVLVVPLLILHPVAFLVLITVAEAANLSEVGAINGLPRGETVLLVFTILAALSAVVRGQVRPAGSPFLALAVVYLVLQTIASLLAEKVPASLLATAATGKALLWPLAVGLLLLARDRAPGSVARGFAATLALLSALTLFQQFVLENSTDFFGLANVPLAADIGGVTARHAGPQADQNFWARVLVLGLPLALSLAKMAKSRWRRGTWIVAAMLICGGVFLTSSRGGLLATFVVVVAWALLTGGWAAKALLFAPFAIGAALYVPGLGSRLLSLSSGVGQGFDAGDPSLAGRVAAQRVAFQMFLDHPVAGVGPGDFIAVAPQYLLRLGLNTPLLAPHNSYLEAAAEGGLLGLIGWLLLLGGAAFVAFRARTLARVGGPEVDAHAPLALSNAVLTALLGWAVASMFLHLATFRTFLLVAALGAALDVRARRQVARLRAEGRLGPSVAPSVSRGPRRGGRLRYALALVVAGLLVTSAALWAAGGTVRGRPVSAVTGMELAVNYTNTTEAPSYDLDVLSRALIVRTFGEIATQDRFVKEGRERVRRVGGVSDGVSVVVTGSTESSLFLVTATGPEAKRTTDMSIGVRDSILDYLNSISSLYGAVPTSGPPVLKEAPRPAFDRKVAMIPLGAAGLITLAAAGTTSVQSLRRRRGTARADLRPGMVRSGDAR